MSFVLLMLRTLTIFNITSSLKQNKESLAIETCCGELGPTLLLARGLDFEDESVFQNLH